MLDKRLQKIYECVMPCSVFADIGTDHGKLAVKVALSCKAERVVASDISEKSLSKAKSYAKKVGANLECVCCDGFDLIPFAEVVVISGMGGITISKIIEQGIHKALYAMLILSPNTEAAFLRKFLAGAGFRITEEHFLCAGGKYYPVIVAEAGKMVLTEEEILLGCRETVVVSSDYGLYLKSLAEKTSLEIATMTDGKASACAVDEKEHVLQLVKEREKWLKALKKYRN